MRYAIIATLLLLIVAASLILLKSSTPSPPKEYAYLDDLMSQGIERFEDLAHLKSLYAEGDVSEEQCQQIARIPNLERLDIVDSNLDDSGLRSIILNRSFSRVCFRGTEISDESAELLREVNGLQYLDVGATNITGDGVSQLLESQSIKELILYDLPVDDEVICKLSRSMKLVKVVVSINNVTAKGIECLSHMGQLHELVVVGRPLTHMELTYLARLHTLSDLRCRANIAMPEMEALAEIKSIKQLDIAPEPFRIDLQALLMLKGLPQLKRLTVQPYHFSAEERLTIKQIMPDVEVIGGS